MGKYEVVFIDADDTLYDFGRSEENALAKSFSEKGITFKPAHLAEYRLINKELWSKLERGELSQADIKHKRFARLFERLSISLDPVAFSARYLRFLSEERGLVEGAVEISKYLASKYKLVLVTNGIAAVQRRRFESSELRRFFLDLVISEEVGRAKPDPGLLEFAAGRAGASDKGAMIIVGDSLSSDVAAGRNFGIDSCWFNRSGVGRGDPVPTYEVRTLAELRGIL